MSDDSTPFSDAEASGGAVVHFPLPDDSHVLTFHLEGPNLRGRIVRLGRTLGDLLGPHDYPPLVEKLAVETVTLAVLLASMLKYDGVFILQAQGDGAITRLVADVTSSGEIRVTAGFDSEKLEKITEETPRLRDLMGTGYLAFTVDQGEYSERYQGIVQLSPESLEGSIHHYFSQSEQVGTAIKMAAARNDEGKWRAGAVMLQHMPDHSNIPQDAKPIAENWNRVQILLQTCTAVELLDEKLRDETLLYRLFHEEGVRVYAPQKLCKGCRCTPEKLKNILKLLPEEDRHEIVQDGQITMTCEFCNKDFSFSPDEIVPDPSMG